MQNTHLINLVGVGEVHKIHTKSLWWVWGKCKKYIQILVVGVGEVCKMHTKSLWLVWEN